jgi:hypothetical protein
VTDLPDGQISHWAVQPCLQKYFCFSEIQIRLYDSHPVPLEGRIAIVTDAGREAVDAAALLTNGAKADGEAVWS